MRISIVKFSLWCGLISGLMVLVGTLFIVLRDGPTWEKTWVGKIYRGYNLSYGGSLIGAVWAFFDGLFGGALVALSIKRFLKKK